MFVRLVRPRLVLTLFSSSISLACARVVTEGATYGIQHTIGVAAGPCPRAMDSVSAARGAPFRRYRSDAEDRSADTQVFWHEWGYRLPVSADGRKPDSVAVVGFRWGSGVAGCEVHERHARAPGARGLPWDDAGTVPVGPVR